MRFFQLGTARAIPIDRNPTNKGATYGGANIAPHGTTSRFSYTVPAGKKAQLQMGQATILRITAAAPVGIYQAVVLVVHLDANQPWAAYAVSLDNNVGAKSQMNFAGPIDLVAGEQIITSTSDASTGGTVNYNVASSAVEYDA